MTSLIVKLAGGACTLLAVLGSVAAGTALFVMVLMPFVFPLFLAAVGVATWRASTKRARAREQSEIPAALPGVSLAA
jgi:ABC-type transport system involved in cytochrome bd biosynthesis fused ATPase/permease subunit